MTFFRLLSVPAVLVSTLLISSSVQASPKNEFSEFSAKNLDGEEVSFEKYKDKCVLVVNTASGCGLTDRTMKLLNKLNEDYPGLEIVAIPTNAFKQEKKSNEELKEFFKSWNAKYDVYEKVDNFKDSEIFQFLAEAAGNSYPKWNYGKYMVQKDGKSVELWGPDKGTFIDWGFTEKLNQCVKK